MAASRHTYGVFVSGKHYASSYNLSLCFDLDQPANTPACYDSKRKAEEMCARFTAENASLNEADLRYEVIQLR